MIDLRIITKFDSTSLLPIQIIFIVFQTQQILQRHLKIGEALSVEQLVQRTKDDGGVRMLRGFFDLKFKEADDGEG